MHDATVYIYGLVDPRTREIRYVGKSTNPTRRLRQHLRDVDRRPCHKSTWIKALLAAGERPRMVILEATSEARWEERERHWIKALPNLTNLSEGGGPPRVREVTAETRARISEAMKGRPNGKKGKPISEQQRAKQSAAMRGRKLSPARRAQISGEIRQRWERGTFARRATPEWREKNRKQLAVARSRRRQEQRRHHGGEVQAHDRA